MIITFISNISAVW